jgi:hypothetical protein
VKKFLLILTVLSGLLLFTMGAQSDLGIGQSAKANQSVQEQNSSRSERQVEMLSNDLRHCTCLVPRRTVESTSNNTEARSQRLVVRALQLFRLKEAHMIHKSHLEKAFDTTTEFSSLFYRTAHQIYALRKIIL